MKITIDSHIREKLAIDAKNSTPTTYFGWLLQLAQKHGKEGLRYAIGLKINGSIILKNDGTFDCFSTSEQPGFRWLVIEILSWDNDHSTALFELLAGEYSWAIRYIKDLVPSLEVSNKPPFPLPLSPPLLNKRLAFDFKGLGLPYALRFFTAPAYIGTASRCEHNPYEFSSFLEYIYRRNKKAAANLTDVMSQDEFSPWLDLLSSNIMPLENDSVLDLK